MLDDRGQDLRQDTVPVYHGFQDPLEQCHGLQRLHPVPHSCIQRAVVKAQQEHGTHGVQPLGQENRHPQVGPPARTELNQLALGVGQGVLVMVVLVDVRLGLGQQPADEPPALGGDGVYAVAGLRVFRAVGVIRGLRYDHPPRLQMLQCPRQRGPTRKWWRRR